MVSAGDDGLGPCHGDPFQRLIEELDDVHGGQRTIIDVARDEHHIHALLTDCLLQLIDEKALRFEHSHAVEGTAQMPV